MLDERDIQMLRAVVDAYVRDGKPVSSLAVQTRLGLPTSTATIRNVMARLERNGYLMKPHISAGRIPTDTGYRAYVDHLEANHTYVDTFAKMFREQLRARHTDVGTIMAAASRILGGLSRHLAMVYGSVIQESHVVRIQLIELEGARLLAVVNLSPDDERTAVLRTERRFTPSVVARAEEWINREVRNKTLQQAKEALDSAVRDNVTDEGILAREVAVHREDIFSDPPAVEFYFEERQPVLAQPELYDPKLLQLLLRILQNKEYLTSLLSEHMGEPIRVTIGEEHQDDELRPFSLVTAGYRMGVARGVLGVIGPTRMQYDLVHALVGSAALGLEAIGEEYF
jgi:heat-inducible transcriptional repressor